MKKLTYTESIELGFKRIESNDPVWFMHMGYNYFIVHLKLKHSYAVDWDIETHELKLYRHHNLVREISIDELKFLIEIIK